MKILARCARLRSSRSALREAVEQATGECSFACGSVVLCYHCLADSCCVPVEKETVEKHAAELKERAAELEERAAKLEGELNSLRKEREDRRAEEEAAAQARDALASRLRSMAGGLSGESQNSRLFVFIVDAK